MFKDTDTTNAAIEPSNIDYVEEYERLKDFADSLNKKCDCLERERRDLLRMNEKQAITVGKLERENKILKNAIISKFLGIDLEELKECND